MCCHAPAQASGPLPCLLLLLLLLTLCTSVLGQPGGGAGGGGTASVSGQSTASSCPSVSSGCSSDGSSNYVVRSLTYSTSTGLFSGSITTNGCSNNKWGRYSGVDYTSTVPTRASCITQTFPAPAYTTTPVAAPLRAQIGLTLYGVNIYGPFEAGFSLGQACDNSLGYCAGGLDVSACFQSLSVQCGASHIKVYMGMDDCGGHDSTYHIHTDPVCDYNKAAAGHSTLVGVMLDGRGMYGQYETTATAPTDLDACQGHYGPVPSYTVGTAAYAAASYVYHYHVSAAAPFTLGCYGPVSSLAACRALYPTTCGSGFNTTFPTPTGSYVLYDLDCPCFKMGSDTYNQAKLSSSASSSSPPPSPSTSYSYASPPPAFSSFFTPVLSPSFYTVQYTFQIDFTTLSSNTALLSQFKTSVQSLVAAAAGVSTSSVTIKSTMAGSVIITTQIDYSSSSYSQSQASALAAAAAASPSTLYSVSFLSTYGATAGSPVIASTLSYPPPSPAPPYPALDFSAFTDVTTGISNFLRSLIIGLSVGIGGLILLTILIIVVVTLNKRRREAALVTPAPAAAPGPGDAPAAPSPAGYTVQGTPVAPPTMTVYTQGYTPVVAAPQGYAIMPMTGYTLMPTLGYTLAAAPAPAPAAAAPVAPAPAPAPAPGPTPATTEVVHMRGPAALT